MTNKPGFYVATVRGVEGVRGLLRDDDWFFSPARVKGLRVHGPDLVTDLRPLVMLDHESDEDCDTHTRAAFVADGEEFTEASVVSMREATRRHLLALANPAPPLVEPNGLGAVVESANGLRRWVYGGDRKWRDEYGTVLGFPQNARRLPRHGRVLSHGYGCTCGGPDCPGGAS